MWIFFWGCSFVGAGLICVAQRMYRQEYKELSRRYDGRPLGVWRWFAPAGYFVVKRLSRRVKNQRIWNHLQQLVSQGNISRIYQIYLAQKVGGILCFLLLGCFVGGGVALVATQFRPVTQSFWRNEHEGGDKAVSLQAVIQEDGKTVQQEILVPIPQQEATEAQKTAWLEEAGGYIHQYFSEHEAYTEEPVFPKSFGHATFVYFSKEPEWIQDNGVLLGEWPQEEKTVAFEVTVWVEELYKTLEVEVCFCGAGDLPPERQLDLLQEELRSGKYMTAEEVVLPGTTAGGHEILWTTQEVWQQPWLWVGLVFLLGIFFGIRQDENIKEEIRKRDKRILRVYPEMVNEITILISAGLTLQNAWVRVVDSYEKRREQRGIEPLYEAMRQTVTEMKNGISFSETLRNFGEKNQVKEIKKFTRLLIADRKRGDTRMLEYLREMNEEAWELRKKQAREKSEEADTRLLLPLMMMLVVILIIVLAPAMLTIRG